MIEFQTSDPITEYWSPVGNSDVPYPVAFSSKYAYFMLDLERVPLADFTRTPTLTEKQELYHYYYGFDDKQLIPDGHHREPFARQKTLHERQ